MPPRLELWPRAVPLTEATTGVPRGERMSVPWWRRPPERGWPQSLVNARGPCTGHIQEPVGVNDDGRRVPAVDAVRTPPPDDDEEDGRAARALAAASARLRASAARRSASRRSSFFSSALAAVTRFCSA